MVYLIRSIFLYLGLFGFSLYLFAVAERSPCYLNDAVQGSSLKYKMLPRLTSGMAILLLCLAAAFRADNVGVDTSLYPDAFMNAALRYSSFIEFWNDPFVIPSDEPLHAMVVWLCSRFTSSKALLLFVYQLLTVLPVYGAARLLRNRVNVPMAMLVYMTIFYNYSLNLMRQSVSCAFILLALTYLIKRGRICLPFLGYSIVAVLFHRSGLYGFALLIIASLVYFSGKPLLRAALCILIVFLPPLLLWIAGVLISCGIADAHIQVYFDYFQSNNHQGIYYLNPLSRFSIAYLGMYGWLIFLPDIIRLTSHTRIGSIFRTVGGSPIFSWLLPDKNEEDFTDTITSFGTKYGPDHYWNYMNRVGFLIYVVTLFGMQTNYGSRFTLYFDYLLIVSLGSVCKEKDAPEKIAVIVLSLFAIWFVLVMYMGWSGSEVYYFFFE